MDSLDSKHWSWDSFFVHSGSERNISLTGDLCTKIISVMINSENCKKKKNSLEIILKTVILSPYLISSPFISCPLSSRFCSSHASCCLLSFSYLTSSPFPSSLASSPLSLCIFSCFSRPFLSSPLTSFSLSLFPLSTPFGCHFVSCCLLSFSSHLSLPLLSPSVFSPPLFLPIHLPPLFSFDLILPFLMLSFLLLYF